MNTAEIERRLEALEAMARDGSGDIVTIIFVPLGSKDKDEDRVIGYHEMRHPSRSWTRQVGESRDELLARAKTEAGHCAPNVQVLIEDLRDADANTATAN